MRRQPPTDETTAAATRRGGVRIIAERIEETIQDLPETEQEFYRAARQQVQRLQKGRDKAAERRERDALAISALANAMVDLGDYDAEAFRDLPIAKVAAMAEIDIRQANRLRRDAYWLARDLVTDDPAKKAGESDYERDLRIARTALTSGLMKTKHLKPDERHYSPRQAHLVDDHDRQEKYLSRMADEPRAQSHIVERHDADGVLFTRHQTASDRFDPGGRGYVGQAGWVGGSSTQENGGTCWQDELVEKGKRSDKCVLTQRFIAATPKAPNKRHRGISNKKVIQRIRYLDGIGKTPEEIAADDLVKETVSRVKGALHRLGNDTRHWTGDNNDRRHVHLKKWAALDQIHGNTRTDCREIWRVDVDRVFDCWQDVLDHISTLKVRPQKVNFIRDDRFPERVTRPHYLYYLPEGSGVWYDESKGMAMLEAAAAAITIDAGGDIGGLANLHDMKQPTSPRVVSITIEVERLPTLSELCKLLDVDLKENLVVTMRQQSVAQMVAAGVSASASNAFYTIAGKRGLELCKLWEGMGELRVDAELDRRRLGEEIADRLLVDHIMVDELSKLRASTLTAAENSIRVAAKKVAEFYGKGKRASSRGYDLRAAESEVAEKVAEVRANAPADLTPAELKKLEIHAAQIAGRDYCNRTQVESSVRRIADAMLEISKTGTVPGDKAVTKLSGMDIRTVRRHWDAAVALTGANAIVAAVMDAPPTVPDSVDQADTIPAAAPAKCSGVRGVTTYYAPQAQPSQPSGQPMTLQSVISAPMLPLVNALRPWNPSFGAPATGRAMLEFCRPGFTVYRSAAGIRQKAARRRKGRSVVIPCRKSGTAP